MAATVQRAMPGLLAERASIRALTGRPAEAGNPSDYLGATQSIIDATLDRAERTGAQR